MKNLLNLISLLWRRAAPNDGHTRSRSHYPLYERPAPSLPEQLVERLRSGRR